MIRYEQHDRTAVITIDRPEARNAIDPDAARGIEAALDRAEADDGVGAVVLTGAEPIFCAGADLKAIDSGLSAQLFTERGGFAGVTRRARVKPLIAAIEGAALAGGLEIALSCDLVVAARDAPLGLPEVRRGLVAAAGGLFRLSRRIPLNLALELVLTGDPVPAHELHRHALVNRVTEPGEALAAALELAARVTANAPLAVAESRRVVLAATHGPEDVGWALSAESNARVLASEDVQEGVRAFVEKRPPVWTGR